MADSSQCMAKQIQCCNVKYIHKLKRQTNYNNNKKMKRPWCRERLKAGGEGDDRGWDGWMASPTQWICVWINSGRWWWTGRSGVLQSMGSQSRTELSDWTELNWTLKWTCLQGSNGDTAIENRRVDTVGEGAGRMNRNSNTETYTSPNRSPVGICCVEQGAQTPSSVTT